MRRWWEIGPGEAPFVFGGLLVTVYVFRPSGLADWAMIVVAGLVGWFSARWFSR